MIRKPAQDWGREDPAIALARSAASVAGTGVAAVRTGGQYLRAIFCLGFAGLWALAALGALAAGSFPTAIGVGLMSAGVAWIGMRALAKARGGDAPKAAAPVAAAPSSRNGQAPRTIRYSAARLLRSALICGAFACAGAWAAINLGGGGRILAVVATPVFAAAAVASILRMFGDPAAIAYDDRILTVTTLWGRRVAPWSEVVGVQAMKTNTYALYGLIRVGSSESLSIRVKGGLFGTTRLGLSTSLLDLDGTSLAALVAEMQAAQAGRATAPAAAASPLPRPQRADTAAQARGASAARAGYDPDAAIARRLAERAAPAPPPPTAAPGARATFGRRVA